MSSGKKTSPAAGVTKKIVSRKKERRWGKIISGKMMSKLAGEQRKGLYSFLRCKVSLSFGRKIVLRSVQKKRNRCSTRFPEFSFRSLFISSPFIWERNGGGANCLFVSSSCSSTTSFACAGFFFFCKIGSRKHTDLTIISSRLHKTLYLN